VNLSQPFERQIITWLFLMSSFFYILIAYIPSSANACSCAQPPSVKSELSSSDVVFSGKVISVREKRSLNGYLTKQAIFEVSQTWKGVKQSQIMITTGQGGGDCGINFIEGEDYLVYSRESDMYGKKLLTSIICDRTVELVAANEDLSVLGEGKPPVEKVDIVSNDVNSRNLIFILFGVIVAGLIAIWGWKRIKKGR
jgi:hypothetical protein